MKLLLPYFIIFILVVQYLIKKNTRKSSYSDQYFWEKEHKSNMIRKKDISGLNYITIPDSLNIPKTDNPAIIEEWNNLVNLKSKKILNLTGISNTDLKLQYGTSNITVLSEYDNNFTKLTRCISNLGNELMKNGYIDEAVAFYEYGISINTDNSNNYIELAKYYSANGKIDEISQLITQAENLSSLMKDSIIAKLKKYI